MHGISRTLAGVGVFTAALEKQFAATPFPHFAVRAFGGALPWAEALVGLLILVGGATRIALVAGGLLILVLTSGSTLPGLGNCRAAIDLRHRVLTPIQNPAKSRRPQRRRPALLAVRGGQQ